MSNQAILAFNSGILSPKIDTRIDVDKLQRGCRVLDNMIPTKYGTAERRPGFKYYDEGLNTIVMLIPFIYSASIAYFVELSDKAMRFYYNGVLIEGTNIVTDYVEADIFQLDFQQIADIMWITHPNYKTRTLSRTSPVTFSLSNIDFTKGPFLLRNDLIDINNSTPMQMTPSVTDVDEFEIVYYEGLPVTYEMDPVYSYTDSSSGTLTATDEWFLPGHVGALFKLTYPRTDTIVDASGADPVASDTLSGKGVFTVVSRGTWTGTFYVQRKENNAEWENFRSYKASDDRNIIESWEEEEDNVSFRINAPDDMTAGFKADISIQEGNESGIVKITGIQSTTVAYIQVISKLASTDATTRWSEGAWSDVSGHPASVGFFQDRLVYAGEAGRVEL